jgi:thymidine kinase
VFTPKGSIAVITGCMFSGKSEITLRELRRMEIARRRILLLRPAIDDRTELEVVRSRSGAAYRAQAIRGSGEIVKVAVAERADVVAIEEAQFLDDGVVEAAETLARRHVAVIVNGLNQDFLGRPFGPMPKLMAIADRVTVLTAICTICGDEATKTQRLVDGRPATPDDPLIVIGGLSDERYEARCRLHHEIG